jgi:hypothetical protein
LSKLKEFTIQFWVIIDKIDTSTSFIGFNDSTWTNGFGHYENSSKSRFLYSNLLGFLSVNGTHQIIMLNQKKIQNLEFGYIIVLPIIKKKNYHYILMEN